MRGHQPLIDMRRQRILPSDSAWVLDMDSPVGDWLSRNWHGFAPSGGPLQPHIAVGADDVIEVLDFRCLVGMTVHLQAGRGDDRAKRLFAAIRKVQPKVLACCRKSELWIFKKEEGGNGKRIPA